MPAFNDLAGQQFGRWVVIGRDKTAEDADLGTCWKVRCICGNTERTLTHKNLKRSSRKDICRCYREDVQQRKHSKGLSSIHGRARKPSTFACRCGGLGIDRGYGMRPSQCDDCRTKRRIQTWRRYDNDRPKRTPWPSETPPRTAETVSRPTLKLIT
jgi:hypothetical protein